MDIKAEARELADRMEDYLTRYLLPFWLNNAPDPQYGGLLTYFDRNGRKTDKTAKTFLMQIRMLAALCNAHRSGYGDGRCLELARQVARFIADHYWDDQNDGWTWIADRSGTPTFTGKIGYGQCFGIYSFSEYFLASGHALGRQLAERTYSAVCRHMLDTRHGGYYEIMTSEWQPERPGKYGGDRKSMDVHMHMMEGLTGFYEMTRLPTHRRRLIEIIDLICSRMLHREHGTGYMQFALDFTPLPAIMFAVEWGSDEEPEAGSKPLDFTSYGHNVEFAWLLLHAADILGVPRQTYGQIVRGIFDQCIEHGIDRRHGGVYIEGPIVGEPVNFHKQFWQHAEVMVGLLDAVALFGEPRYWEAFRNVHDFVFSKFVNLPAGGEWYALLDRDGTPVWDYLGHEWKCAYHTLRGTVQTIRRLRALAG